MHRTKLKTLAVAGILLVGAASTNALSAQSDEDVLAAAGAGNAGMLSTLVQLQGNPSAADSLGYTALMYASQVGAVDAIQVLVDAGADVNAVSSEGWTALLLSALQGQAEAATALLGHGADPAITFGGGFTPLMVAAARGNAAVAEALVAGGLSTEDALSDGRTALMAAAEGGHVEVVEKLLELGADVNAQSNGGGTAATSAVRNGHLAVVPALAEAGALFVAGMESLEGPSDPQCPRPQWPESVWEVELEGQVVVEFVVDAEGETEDESVVLISTPHPDLEEAAIEMFQGCTFEPGEIDGTKVRVKLRQGLGLGG